MHENKYVGLVWKLKWSKMRPPDKREARRGFEVC